MSFVRLDLELTAETLVEEMYAVFEAAFPGWEPHPGSPEVFLIRALVYRLVVPLAELAVDVPDRILERFGAELAAVPPIVASSATVSSTWKFADTEGHTIPAGTQVDVIASADVRYGFVALSAVEVPAGKSETEAGEVLLEAIDAGEAANGYSEAELVDALLGFDSLALVGETANGTDDEDPLVYLGRLAETMRIQAPRPIRASDVAILLRSIAGIQRVAVIDNYNHETKKAEEEKTLSAYPIDADGQAVSAPIQAEAKALLEAKREVNFIFFVEDPTYTKIKVRYQVVAREGFGQAATEEAVAAAIENLYSPATHGADPNSSDAVPTIWNNELTLRYQDLVTVVNNVVGVEHYTELKFGKEGGALGTVDVTIDGPAGLPEPGSIAVGP